MTSTVAMTAADANTARTAPERGRPCNSSGICAGAAALTCRGAPGLDPSPTFPHWHYFLSHGQPAVAFALRDLLCAGLGPRTSWACRRLPARDIQIDEHRHVVGRLVPGAHVIIDAGVGQPVGGLRRQQQVVDADAVVLLPGPGLVVPERVQVGSIAGGADGVGEAEIQETAEFLPGLRQEQRVLHPGLRPARIA